MATPGFTKRVIGEVVNDTPPGPMNTSSAVGDVNSSGLPDARYPSCHAATVVELGAGRLRHPQRYLNPTAVWMPCACRMGGSSWPATRRGKAGRRCRC